MTLRGFARMTPEQRSAIASMGGRAVHVCGSGHKFTSEEAKDAGRKGGAAVSQDREHMRAIGRMGGQAKRDNSQREVARKRELKDMERRIGRVAAIEAMRDEEAEA